MVEAATAGTLALWGAIGASAASLLAPPRHSRRLQWAAVALAALATVVLTASLLAGDFTLSYVAETTSRATPWPYRLAALWGGMEGSLLFYTLLILAVGTAGVRGRGRVEHAVVSLTGLGLLLLTALASNPFQRLDIPAVDGQGLLAILQHPAMVYHPPILYLGLTTLIVPFAIGIGALASGDTARVWSPQVRYRLMSSWALLALGMVAGANWAYVELGWGGFWAWDPVENTALMPWLAATAYLHTSRVTERDGRLRRWTAFLSLFPFALSVLGVYLTRSGVTGSIHAFAEDPVIGRILLTASLVAVLVVLVMTYRAPAGGTWGRFGVGRDLWLAIAGVTTALATVFVLVGSAYPAYLQVFWDRTLVVDARFFVTTMLPIGLVVAALIGFALLTTWGRANLGRRDLGVFSVGALAAAGLALTLADGAPVAAILLAVMATGALALLLRDLPRRRAGRLFAGGVAHLGIAMVLVGAAGSAMGADFAGTMSPGDVITVGSHRIELVSIGTGEGDRYLYAEGLFLVDGHELRPQIRAYEDQELPVAEPALRSTPISDVIVAVSVLSPDVESFEVSVFVRPMVWWVWIGALVVALAGGIALARRRVDGEGRRPPATAGPPPAGTTTVAIDR
jgi:cytochrome c-type biogenesis protein CcmF